MGETMAGVREQGLGYFRHPPGPGTAAARDKVIGNSGGPDMFQLMVVAGKIGIDMVLVKQSVPGPDKFIVIAVRARCVQRMMGNHYFPGGCVIGQLLLQPVGFRIRIATVNIMVQPGMFTVFLKIRTGVKKQQPQQPFPAKLKVSGIEIGGQDPVRMVLAVIDLGLVVTEVVMVAQRHIPAGVLDMRE